MAFKYWRDGAGEVYRSLRKSAFVGALQRLVPVVHDSDFVRAKNVLHVLNVPSPAATASLAIGREILRMVTEDVRAACVK